MRYPSGDTQVTPRTPRGFVARMLAYYPSRALVPLYSVYSLLFRDHGLSLGQISSLFILCSLTSFVFEVPSGPGPTPSTRPTVAAGRPHLPGRRPIGCARPRSGGPAAP